MIVMLNICSFPPLSVVGIKIWRKNNADDARRFIRGLLVYHLSSTIIRVLPKHNIPPALLLSKVAL